MRALGCLPLLLLSVALSPALAADPKEEMKAFQGEWRLTGMESDGERRDAPDGDGATIVFEGDKLFVGGEEKFTFKIDPTCDPKIIDVIRVDDKDQVLEGIYRFDGKKLTICLHGASAVKMRPLKFGEESTMVFTLERPREE
jgi:uncharacterized protein (TIGR03067 family)